MNLHNVLFQIGLIAELSEQWKAEDREIRARCAGKTTDQIAQMCFDNFKEMDRLMAQKRALISKMKQEAVS